jgi:hypothetical protein
VNTDRIDISSCCDRWWERCAYTSRSALFAAETAIAIWGKTVFLLGVGLVFVHGAAHAQIPDVTQPPSIVHTAGRFSARQQSRAPTVDGREWIAVDVQTGPAPAIVQAPNRRFSVTLAEAGTDDTGDFERYQLLFRRGNAAPVRIDRNFTAWVYVTPDSRYIVSEPLYVLDVRAWTQYALFEALQIPNYTAIEAISRDRKRLFISRRECAIECKDERVEYYELTLP